MSFQFSSWRLSSHMHALLQGVLREVSRISPAPALAMAERDARWLVGRLQDNASVRRTAVALVSRRWQRAMMEQAAEERQQQRMAAAAEDRQLVDGRLKPVDGRLNPSVPDMGSALRAVAERNRSSSRHCGATFGDLFLQKG